MISPLLCRIALLLAALLFFLQPASAVIRDGGVDPDNLGQGGWIYILKDATNHLAPSGVLSVTNELTLFKFLKNQGLSYVIVKAGTSNVLWTGSANTNLAPMFTKKLVDAAHVNGLKIFGSNRSWGNDIPGEAAIADYVFQQGADGFIYDAESEWESSNPWIGTNGPALAWQLCSTVRSNWPNKFIAHNPYDTVYLHFSFPFKEFGYWCDAVMPQVYHHSASKNNAIAAIHWSDYNYKRLNEYLASLPPTTNTDGSIIYWTNSIKPLVLMRDVYNGQSGTPSHPDSDVRNFLDYMAADPNCVNENGYNGSDYFRSELHRAGQWANIKAATVGFASNQINNIVIDDARASVIGNGNWTMIKTIDATESTVLFSGEKSGDTNSFGTNYWRTGQGTGTSMQFTPVVSFPGNYDVYEWHPTRADASGNVPFVINSGSGATTLLVNQQTNGGDWNLLGRFYFNAGTNGFVRVMDNFPEPDRVALVDGLKMVYVPIVPAAPSGLKAVAVSPSQINLTWKDNSTNELGFVIARGANAGGPYFDVGSVSPNVTNFADSRLLDNTIYYYVVRARAYNIDSVDSNEAGALTPQGPPAIVTQPLNQTAIEGQSASFSVEATSSSPISYQWEFKNVEIPGATENTLALSDIKAEANAGDYSVVVANQFGSARSDSATLTVNFSLTRETNPSTGGVIAISPDQTGFTSTNIVTLTATQNSGFVFVGWSGDIVSVSNPVQVVMSRSKTLVANFMPTNDIIIDNPEASYSGVWTIGSAAPDKFGSYYQYTSTSGDASAAFYRPNILVPGKYDVSIWYSQGTNRTSRAQVLVAHDGEIQSSELDQTAGGGAWHLVATAQPFAAGTNGFVSIGNNTGENNKIVIADAVRFSFNPGPLIFSQPESQSVRISSDATFQVLAASARPLSYQWQFNGANIPGAISSSYTRTNTQLSDAGLYTVILSNEVEMIASDAATLTVTQIVPVTLTSVFASEEGGFHFSLSGEANATYTIETSTNLVDWLTLTNISSLDGNIEFNDIAPVGSARFYRAHSVP